MNKYTPEIYENSLNYKPLFLAFNFNVYFLKLINMLMFLRKHLFFPIDITLNFFLLP